MTLPNRYLSQSETLVNFDFADILTDVGYVTLYGIDDEAGNFFLSRQQLQSTNRRTDLQTATPDTTSEKNFDIEFNITQKVKGDLFTTITIYADDSAGGGTINTTSVEILHVDKDGTESSIGTQQSITALTDSDGTRDHYRTTLQFSVDKLFKKGEKLRVEVILTITGNNNGSDLIGFYHDGANRDFSITDQFGLATDSNFIVNVPFEIAT